LVKFSRPVKVKILVEPSISSAPIYYAQEKGIFANKEIKVEATIEKVEDPSKALQDLVSGKADFALVPWTEALRWMSEKDDTLLCFFAVEFKVSTPQEGLFPRKGLKFDKISDLEGKTVGVTAGTYTAMKAIVVSTEVDPTTVKIKVYPSDKLLAALESGEVDLILPLEPYFTVAKTHLSEPFADGAMFLKWINSPYLGSGLFVTPEYFRENELAVKRMNKAMELTYLEMAKNQDTTRAIAARALGIEDEQLIERLNLPGFQRAQEIDQNAIQEMADKLEMYGAIPHGLNTLDMKLVISKEQLRD
jgi:ABC-type nitrate/sulfonate/bicarbonate transport system substrate-binding protein